VQESARRAAVIWLRAVMAPEGLLEVSGRAWAGWYSSTSESGVVVVVVGAAGAAAASAAGGAPARVVLVVGRGVLFCFFTGGGAIVLVLLLGLEVLVFLRFYLKIGICLLICGLFTFFGRVECFRVVYGRDATVSGVGVDY
jgi:hypothetical protein